MSTFFYTNMVVDPVYSVVTPGSRPAAVSQLASSQFQDSAAMSSFSKKLNKLSLSRFLESFCVNHCFMTSANWMLGGFGKSCKFAQIYFCQELQTSPYDLLSEARFYPTVKSDNCWLFSYSSKCGGVEFISYI